MIDQAAERAAAGILRAVWAEDLAASQLPIDPVRIARDLAINVYVVQMDDPQIAGMLMKGPNEEPSIYLNASDHPNRQRFTCAHEIGHYDRRSSRDSDEWEFVDYRSTLSSRGTDAEEVYANRFAAALLMPAPIVKALAEVYGKTGLALLFQVSAEAMGHRLRNLNLA